jgi:AbrB family looped-hinge helix DNA binding protein
MGAKQRRIIMPVPMGTLRDLDKLGRVVIPADARRVLDLNPGDHMEVFADPNQKIVYMRKYEGKLDVK